MMHPHDTMDQRSPRPRKLLIVTYHFPPSGAVAVFRMLGFARHLPSYGWKVGVVAPPCVPGEPMDRALLRRVPPETAVFPAAYPNSFLAKAASRGVYHGVWVPRALAAVTRAFHRFRPDAVLTSGPPHCVHFLGLLLKRTYGLPWLVDLRDPWSTNCGPAKGWFPWARWDRFWEKRMVREADCVVANTPLGSAGLQKAYPTQQHKMTFVTNGFDPEFFPEPAPLLPLNARFTILHAGELYSGRDPRPLFDALEALEKMRQPSQAPVRLRLLGQSTENRFDLRSAIEDHGLEEVVELGGQVPYAEALGAMTQADVLLLLDTPGRRVSIPAKLFEYLGAARPILALTENDGDTAWALRASGQPHRIVPPLDAAAIHQALRELRDGLHQGTLARSTAEQLATFTRARLTENLAEHLNRLVPKQQPASIAKPVPTLAPILHDAPEWIRAAPPADRPHYVRA